MSNVLVFQISIALFIFLKKIILSTNSVCECYLHHLGIRTFLWGKKHKTEGLWRKKTRVFLPHTFPFKDFKSGNSLHATYFKDICKLRQKMLGISDPECFSAWKSSCERWKMRSSHLKMWYEPDRWATVASLTLTRMHLTNLVIPARLHHPPTAHPPDQLHSPHQPLTDRQREEEGERKKWNKDGEKRGEESEIHPGEMSRKHCGFFHQRRGSCNQWREWGRRG